MVIHEQSLTFHQVLFFEDNAVVKQSGETHKAAAHMFPQWSEHSDAMAQVQIWTALELEGFGANLQHMSIFSAAEDAIKKEWNVPADYSLKANMNFGGLAQDRPPKPDKLSFDETIKVFTS
jgi:predicted oxidoreductase (fatty acid repression mutant protein)